MRIEGTNNSGIYGPTGSEGSLPKTPKLVQTAGASSLKPVQDETYAQYVNQAKGAEDVNAQAVAEARALLAAGQLDTAEAIERTAAILLDFGI